jgi:hypothetical protein
MNVLLIVEVVAGVLALMLTAAAFIEMSWSEGASQLPMKQAAAARSRRLFIIAGVFWAGALVAFAFMK